jgi:hypothetical protein
MALPQTQVVEKRCRVVCTVVERILIAVLTGIIVFLSCRLIDTRHEVTQQRVRFSVALEEKTPEFF